MKFASILPILALVAFVHAQTSNQKPGSVEGTVTNSATGEPVKKAAVVVQGAITEANAEPTQITAMTDASGHFHFANIEPGAYSISAERDGFIQADRRPGNSSSLTVAAEQQVQDVAIKLLPLAVVSGHVFDEDGDPIVRARIAVLRYFYNSGGKRLQQVAFAQTNDLGEFAALNVQPGRYYFQVMASPPRNIPPRTRWSHPEEAYPVTFYPNSRDAGQTTATDISPGAHITNIDFRLHKVAAYHIRGTVIGEAGRADSNRGEVIVQTPGSRLGGNISQASLQSDGSFDIDGVVSGNYELSYRHFQPGKPVFSVAEQMLQVSDADVNAVVLTPKSPMTINGTVLFEGPQTEKTNLQIALSPGGPMRPGGNAIVSADGSFTISDVQPASYEVRVFNPPPGHYVKSIRFADREINGGKIDLSSGVPAPLSIILGADGGEVTGNVQNAAGQPAAAVLVTLAPADSESRADLFKRTMTDSSGHFHLNDVAPGEYRVFAWENDSDGGSQSPEFRKVFEEKSASVTVGPKDRASVQLTLITEDDIEKERAKLP